MNDTASPRTSQVPSSPQSSSNQQPPFSSKTMRRVTDRSVHRRRVRRVQGLAAGKSGSSAECAVTASAAARARRIVRRWRRAAAMLWWSCAVPGCAGVPKRASPQRCVNRSQPIVPRVLWRFFVTRRPSCRDLTQRALCCSGDKSAGAGTAQGGTAEPTRQHLLATGAARIHCSDAVAFSTPRCQRVGQLATSYTSSTTDASTTTDAHACGPEGHLRGAHDVAAR